LSESIADQLCPEALKAANSLRKSKSNTIREMLFQVYLPRIPQSKRDAARDLAQYCVAVGNLFRLWWRFGGSAEGYLGSTEIVEEAILKREEKLESLKLGERMLVEDIIKREEYMIKAMSLKIAKTTGCS
jgi:hypothetical protein